MRRRLDLVASIVTADHPVLIALVWSVVPVVVCAPRATRLLRRRTLD